MARELWKNIDNLGIPGQDDLRNEMFSQQFRAVVIKIQFQAKDTLMGVLRFKE